MLDWIGVLTGYFGYAAFLLTALLVGTHPDGTLRALRTAARMLVASVALLTVTTVVGIIDIPDHGPLWPVCSALSTFVAWHRRKTVLAVLERRGDEVVAEAEKIVKEFRQL